jgi:peptide/nickel transport system permease protein
MLKYLLRRGLIALATLTLITFVVYGLIRSMPGDPAGLQVSLEDAQFASPSETFLRGMRRQMGLDRPWPIGYLEWLGGLVRGDLGRSLTEQSPVTSVIGPRIGPTLLLSGTSLFLAWMLSIPLGIYSAARSGSAGERALSVLLYLLYSLPSFVAALYLLVFLSVNVRIFPLSGLHAPDEVWAALSPGGKAWDLFLHLALPVTCLTYGSLAYYVRFIRSNLREVLRQDYIRTARAKGIGETAVLVRHGFRNSLIPLVTLLGLTAPALLGGSVILERIFGWPGMGNLLFSKVGERDYPVIMGVTLLFSFLVLAGNLLADVLYALVDPRVSAA